LDSGGLEFRTCKLIGSKLLQRSRGKDIQEKKARKPEKTTKQGRGQPLVSQLTKFRIYDKYSGPHEMSEKKE